MNTSEELSYEELEKVCSKHSEKVNAYLIKMGYIKQGESYRSMSWAFRERVLKNPAAFLKAATGETGGEEFEELKTQSPTPSRYRWSFKGATFDFYRLLEILRITNHAQAHALKKIVRAGQSVKSKIQDIDEAIACLQRWREMEIENSQTNENPAE